MICSLEFARSVVASSRCTKRHGICWSSTRRIIWSGVKRHRAAPYEMVERWPSRAAAATPRLPDQLGHQSHFARLRLLDPERFYDYDAFLAEEQAMVRSRAPPRSCWMARPWSENARAPSPGQLEWFGLSDALVPVSRRGRQAAGSTRHRPRTVRNSRASRSGLPGAPPQRYPMPLPEQLQDRHQVMGMMGGNGSDLVTPRLALPLP